MSVSPGNVMVGEFPYGNPGSLGEPLGMWFGEQDITGDGTGGVVIASFMVRNPTDTPTLADARREYCYFIDAIDAQCTLDPGNISAHAFTHNARANVALVTRQRHGIIRATLTNGTLFVPTGKLWGPGLRQEPFFWEPQELLGAFNTWIQIQCSTNTNLGEYFFRVKGRYYDIGVTQQRAFGRLISPPALSQFEG